MEHSIEVYELKVRVLTSVELKYFKQWKIQIRKDPAKNNFILIGQIMQLENRPFKNPKYMTNMHTANILKYPHF